MNESVSIIDDGTGGEGSIGSTTPGRAVGIAVAVTVLALCFNLVAGIALVIPLLILSVDVQGTGALLGLTVAGQIGFLAVAYAVARYRGMAIPITRPTGRQAGYVAGGAVAAMALAVVLSYALEVAGLVPGSVIADAATADPTLFLWIGVLSVLVIGPVEEFLFRGVVQGTLRDAFGPAGAIAGASLLFGSLHLANYTGNVGAIVAGALLISAVGAVFGVLYERTDNLAVPMVAHGLYNLVLTTVGYLTV